MNPRLAPIRRRKSDSKVTEAVRLASQFNGRILSA